MAQKWFKYGGGNSSHFGFDEPAACGCGHLRCGDHQYLGRLNADGTLDPAFNPSPMGGLGPPVSCLALQADGEILVGGAFTFLGGQQQRYIGRLNPDGTLDTSFNPAPSGFFPIFPAIYSMVLQPDNEIIIGGNFDSLGGWAITNIGRVGPDGTIDGSFNPGASGPIYCLALQPDGRILVGGSFTNLSGQGCTNLGRLQVDGTLDNGFSPS